MKRPIPGPDPGQIELLRPPAPGALELVRRFVNTRNAESGADALATPEGLTTWLRENGLLDRKTRATKVDLAEARAVREALRAMGRRNNGIPCECDAACLEAAAERSRLVLAFDAFGGSALRPSSSGVDGALGNLLAAVYCSMLDRSWLRFKVCAGESCSWAYYDHSKNGCSRWCSAEGCGNRDKVKRFRERRAMGNAPEFPAASES